VQQNEEEEEKVYDLDWYIHLMKYCVLCILALLFLSSVPDWTHTARIADMEFWPDFTEEELIWGVDEVHAQGLSACLVWLTSENIDIPSEDLSALKTAVTYAHHAYPEMNIIVYTAPLEIISPHVDADRNTALDPGAMSIFSQHPEWLQVGMDGRKAVFYGDFEFWIGESDEDAWCCPHDPVYRKKIMESFRQLAETGIDGIWIDVTQFLCTYGTWEENWACHCEDCQRKFHEDTGLQIPDHANWDRTWKKWILWRQQAIEQFVWELSQVATSVNRDIKIIVEHWHGFDAGSTENAWSPVGLQKVTHVLAHEYVSASDSVYTYTPINYLRDMAIYHLYQGMDRDHASWILSYSREKDSQNMLAASILTAGCNYYDTVYPDMADSVSLPHRTRIFQWLSRYEQYYYGTRPLFHTALYYSKATIDFYDCPTQRDEFYNEFMGVSMMLLSLHVPYQVVTELQYLDQVDTLILPHVVCLSDEEKCDLEQFLKQGGTILCTGKTGSCNEWGDIQSEGFIERGIIYPTFFFTSEMIGNTFYHEVNPFFWSDEATTQGDGQEVISRFTELCDTASVYRIPIEGADHTVVLPFLLTAPEPALDSKAGTSPLLVYRIVNFQGISEGHAKPEPHSCTIIQRRPVLHAHVIPFLSSPESIPPAGNALWCTVKDHCIVTVELEPVSIFTNEFDLPAARILAQYLQARGIPVQFITDPEESTSLLIIFGGHHAKRTGHYVSRLLSGQQKKTIEESGNGDLFIIPGDTYIIIIAGSDREYTALVSETNRRKILTYIVS